MSANTAESVVAGADVSNATLFVINLCASTSPMALVHPSNPELKRYTFFVTRQREEGRERFRLHMGYFTTQAEAEALLLAVRDVYPAAWAGPAPTSGLTRRARASATPVASVIVAPSEASVAAVAPVAVPEPVAVRTPAVTPALATTTTTATAAAAAAAVPTVAQTPTRPVAPPAPTLETMSNVRDVLASLGDERPAPRREPPAPGQIPTLSESQTLRVLEVPLEKATAPVPSATAAVPAQAPAAVPAKPQASVPVPEARKPKAPDAPAPKVGAPRTAARKQALPAGETADENQVRVVTPEDTQTLRDIRLDKERNAPPVFAVQLLWSVTPIAIADHPHLAIFDAYTLYNVEGNRQGRKWYGLRLGFFTDPNSATQVAFYVRSDYPTVAVVPVAEKERDGAKGNAPAMVARKPVLGPAQKPQGEASLERGGLEGFELLQDDRPAPAKRDVDDAPLKATDAESPEKLTMKPVTPRSAPVATGKPSGKRVMVRNRTADGRVTPGATTPMEQTLEILGASTLTLDESREVINDTAVRKPVKQPSKGAGGRLSRLLNRLGSK